MKMSAKVVEVENEGLVSALNKKVLIFGLRYNYAGILDGVNSDCIKLVKACIVFDTGKFEEDNWATAEVPKSSTIYVQKTAIESWVTYG